MMDNRVGLRRLTLVVDNDQQHATLREALTSGTVRVLDTYDRNRIWSAPAEAAVHVSIPVAERWGSQPLVHTAQLLETTPDDRKNGMPRYVIAGVALRPHEERPRDDVVRLAVGELQRVVREHNRRSHATPIHEVVALASTLGAHGDDLEWFGALLEELQASDATDSGTT